MKHIWPAAGSSFLLMPIDCKSASTTEMLGAITVNPSGARITFNHSHLTPLTLLPKLSTPSAYVFSFDKTKQVCIDFSHASPEVVVAVPGNGTDRTGAVCKMEPVDPRRESPLHRITPPTTTTTAPPAAMFVLC
eukprot:m.39151 g.39151  ORF g.39151 m.39151 type:complete len:134 (-) comp5548_c0_seq1:118-519(-)